MQELQSGPVTDRDQIEAYITSSIKNAFMTVSGFELNVEPFRAVVMKYLLDDLTLSMLILSVVLD